MQRVARATGGPGRRADKEVGKEAGQPGKHAGKESFPPVCWLGSPHTAICQMTGLEINAPLIVCLTWMCGPQTLSLSGFAETAEISLVQW